MTSPFAPIAIAVAALALVYHIRHMAQSRTNRQDPLYVDRAILLMLACITIGTAANWPPVSRIIDATTALPNSAHFLADTVGLSAIGAAQVLFLRLTAAQNLAAAIRLRITAAVAIQLLLTMAFMRWGATTPTPHGDHRVALLLCMAAHLVYVVLALADLVRLSMRYTKVAPTPARRVGSRMITVGNLMVMAYIVLRALTDSFLEHGQVAQSSGAILHGLLAAGTAAGAIGLVTPPITPHLVELRRLPLRRRQYRELHPLWFALYQAVPEIALSPPTHPERPGHLLHPVGAYRRLYRRIIEIHDGI